MDGLEARDSMIPLGFWNDEGRMSPSDQKGQKMKILVAETDRENIEKLLFKLVIRVCLEFVHGMARKLY